MECLCSGAMRWIGSDEKRKIVLKLCFRRACSDLRRPMTMSIEMVDERVMIDAL